MVRQILMLVSFSVVTTMTLAGCRADLIPVGHPHLHGPPSFCRLATEGPDEGDLEATVKNRGRDAAPASTTRVQFSPGGSFPLATPAIPAGDSVGLPALRIPAACYNPDCDFTITVDSNGEVSESNEGNNSAYGSCLG